ncbi:MAG: hypothetical protein JNM22_07515 [Saprospiraceae bacterium]|nr:hypothetical protein [Saprospiraceae bacterium]
MYRFFWLFITLCCLISSCTKNGPTILKGKIVDSVTGEPVRNANITFGSEVPPRISHHGSEVVYNETAYNEWAVTNEQGIFEHTFGSDVISAWFYKIIADGYLYKHVNFNVDVIHAGEEKECEIPLVHSDAVLRIYIKNETGQQPYVYLDLKNPSIQAEAGLSLSHRADLNVGQEQILFVDAVSDEYTTVSWSLENFITNQLPPMHEDNILMVKNDTVHYSIIY